MRKKRDVDYGYDGGGRERNGIRDIEQQAFFSPSRSSSSSGSVRIPIPKEDVRHPLLHEDWCEAGPSRITIDDLERMERERDESLIKENKRTRKRYSTGLGGLVAIASATALLPVVHAAPPPLLRQRKRRPSSRTLPPKPTRTLLQPNPRQVTSTTAPQPESLLNDEPIEYDIKYLTSMSTPTHALPTDVYVVDEQRLPFYLTRNDDGEWTKVDDAWFLYGRQAGDVSTANFGPGDDPSATAQTTSAPTGTSQFAITDNLPPGWGIEATRSNFYITPLIVAMSVILALMIVAGIIFIVIKRRKEHRRAKRRAARLRRKALAAAGLTEEDVKNDAHTGGAAGGIDAGLREKLTEIDKLVKKPRKEKERGPTAMIRTKVRSWNQGVLRRRKGAAAGAAGSLRPSRSATPSIEVISETDTAKEVHRGSSDTIRTTPTVASHSSHERGAGGTSGSGSGEATTSDSNTGETPSSTELSRAITQPPPTAAAVAAAGNGATYFPPAYRPASVRSLQMHPTSSTAGGSARGASSSSPSSGEEHLAPPPTVAEKTNAPGYYPAPATADAEEALAVASRSDGKQRMDAPPPPSSEDEAEENRIRHIATDDKRVLERMRIGASAPPQASAAPSVRAGEESGPSAPTVEVDEQGFERHHHDHDPVEPPEDDEGAASASASGSALPRPPQQRPTLSYRLYSQDDLATSLGIDMDERHLLPSAPPPPAHPDHLAPSAPPMLDDGGGEGDTTVSAPPAAAFEIGEEDDDSANQDHGHSHSHSESGIDGGDEYARTDTNDTRDLAPTPPRSSSPIPNPNQPRNPSLPTYEP